jgi:hypothetical protein
MLRAPQRSWSISEWDNHWVPHSALFIKGRLLHPELWGG